jgi:hypothetical protein
VCRIHSGNKGYWTKPSTDCRFAECLFIIGILSDTVCFECALPSSESIKASFTPYAKARIKQQAVGYASFLHSSALAWSPFGHGSDGHEV